MSKAQETLPSQATDEKTPLGAHRANMQNNNKAYQVCVLDSEGPLKSYVEVLGIDAERFQSGYFSCDLWVYPQNGDYILLSQEKGFSFGVQDDLPFFLFSDGKRVSVGSSDTSEQCPALLQRQWNNVFITYDNNTISFYIQGCPVYAQEVGSHPVVSKGNSSYRIGEGLSGLVRTVRIYNNKLEDSFEKNEVGQFVCQQNYNQQTMGAVVVWINCTDGGLINVTPLQLKFQRHNLCFVDSAVQALQVIEDDYAYSKNNDLNPICTKEHQFAVFIKFFTCTWHDKQVLFSNGDFHEKDSWIIYLKRRAISEEYQICMQIGNCIMEFEEAAACVQANTWNDLLVTFQNEDTQIKAYLYLNGALSSVLNVEAPYNGKQSKGLVKLGNAFEYDEATDQTAAFPFGGYISAFAIFDQNLLEVESKSFANTKYPIVFHDNEPFVYDSGLVALYNFDSGTPVDLISNSQIVLHNNVKQASPIEHDSELPSEQVENANCSFIGAITGTNNPKLYVSEYAPYLPSYEDIAIKNQLSEIDQEYLNILGEVLSQYFYDSSGFTIEPNMMRLFLCSYGRAFLCTSLMTDIRLGNDITVDAIVQFIAESISAADLVILSTFSAVGASGGGLARGGLLAIAAIGAIVAACVVAFATVPCIKLLLKAVKLIKHGIKKVIEWIKEQLEKKKNDEQQKKLIHLTYQGLQVGAIPVIPGRRASLPASYAYQRFVGEPTWNLGCGIYGHPSVFVIDQLANGVIYLDFFLVRTNKSGSKTAKVTLTMKAVTSQGNLFNKFTGTRVDCIVNQNNRIQLVSDGFVQPPLNFLYKYTTTYTITCEINGKQDSQMTLVLPMYSLPRIPGKPIGYTLRNAVITEFLDMLASSPNEALDANEEVLRTLAKGEENNDVMTPQELLSTQKMMDNLYKSEKIQYSGIPPRILDNQNGGLSLQFANLNDIQEKYAAENPFIMGCETFAMVMAYGLNNLQYKNFSIAYMLPQIVNNVRSYIKTKSIYVSGKHHQGVKVKDSGWGNRNYSIDSVNSIFFDRIYTFSYHYAVEFKFQYCEVCGRRQRNSACIKATQNEYYDAVFQEKYQPLDIEKKNYFGGECFLSNIVLNGLK